jgi:hypothetical protein
MAKNQNDEPTYNPNVSEEDRRNVAAIIAGRPKSVSTNYSTGEVVTVYKDGSIVKSTIDPSSVVITKTEDSTTGIGKIELKVRLD